jgi:hypothetical protein
LLWILGDGLGVAERRHIGAIPDTAPINGYGSPAYGHAIWYNRPADFSWMSGYESDPSSVQAIYAAGKVVHLIIWLDPADTTCQSPYGTGSQFLNTDVPRLVNMFKGTGTLYVTVFTEIETMGTYTQANLVTAYQTAVTNIKANAPQARVGIGLGGYDWPNTVGGTRTLTTYEPAFAVSDYLCTQMMQDGANFTAEFLPRWRNAIAQLGSYNKPVMISHLKHWGSQTDQTTAWQSFQTQCLTDDELRKWVDQYGLFAINLMDDLYCHSPYVQTQLRHDFEATDGQWHSGVGSVALATDAAFAGTKSLKHTYTWPTGDVTVAFDNGPRGPTNWSADGIYFGLRVRTTPGLKGAQARLRAFQGGADHDGQWWTLPGGDPFNATDFFDVIGKFDATVMGAVEHVSLQVRHPNSPGGAQNIWIDQWTQGSAVAAWDNGLALMQRTASRRPSSMVG